MCFLKVTASVVDSTSATEMRQLFLYHNKSNSCQDPFNIPDTDDLNLNVF